MLMNPEIKAATLLVAPVTSAQQSFVIKAISKWFTHTDLEIQISKSQISQLIASCYGFKSFESFNLVSSLDATVLNLLPTIDLEINEASNRIKSRLNSLGFKADHGLFTAIIADYLIKATNHGLKIKEIHLEQSVFLHHFIKHYPKPDDWGENPFDLANWLNEIGHLGGGQQLIRDNRLNEQLSFFKKNILSGQAILGKILQESEGIKNYYLPTLTAPTLAQDSDQNIINFKVSGTGYKSKIKLNLLDYQKDILALLLKVPTNNPIYPNEQAAQAYGSELYDFSDLKFLSKAKITKITGSCAMLDELHDIGLSISTPQNIEISVESLESGYIAQLTCSRILISIYGAYQGFTFKQNLLLNTSIQQTISSSPKLLIKPCSINEDMYGLNGTMPVHIETSILLKRDKKLVLKDFTSSVCQSNHYKHVKQYETVLNHFIQKMNKYIFSNKYPLEIAYQYLNKEYIQQQPKSLAHVVENPKALPSLVHQPYLIDTENPLLSDIDELYLSPDDIDFIVPDPVNDLLITPPKFKLSQVFGRLKGASRNERMKYKNLFLGRHQLVFQHLDSKKPPIKIDYNLVKPLMDNYLGKLKSQGYMLGRKEYQQKELDLISDHLNFLIHTQALRFYDWFDLSEGRLRFLAPNHKQKIVSRATLAGGEAQKESIEFPLTRKQKHNLFDGATGAKPVVVKERFNLFFQRHGLSYYDQQGNAVRFHNFSDRDISEFKTSFMDATGQLGMFKTNGINNELLEALNAWVNHQLSIGNIQLPSFLQGEQFKNFAIVRKASGSKTTKSKR